jgi:hypothetical protein
VAKWQYLVSRIPTADMAARLNSLGDEGWELVTALPVQTFEYRDANRYGDKDWNAPVAVHIYDVDCIFKREVARG